MKKQREVRKITESEWLEEGKELFGEDMKQWRFKCSNCGHIQTVQDFIDLGVKEPENYVFFSCIGRFMPDCEGTVWNDKSPCDYTLGGLIPIVSTVVIRDNGKEVRVFEFDK